MPSPFSVTKRYHQATNYTPESLRGNPQLDFAAQPPPFKEWVQARRVALVGTLPTEAHVEPGPVTAKRLGVVLHHTYGVTWVRQEQGNTMRFRAAPSAGGLYPAELYVAVRGIDGIPDGILAYRAPDHSLIVCWEGDFWRDLREYTFADPAIADAKAVLIGTGVYQRSAWRYRDRAYRRVLLDTGHVFGNALMAGHAMGWGVRLLPDFIDDGINGLLLLDPAVEGALMLAALTDHPELPQSRSRTPRRSSAQVPEDTPHEGTWIPVVHRAGHLDANPGAPLPADAAAMPAPIGPPISLSDVVLPPGQDEIDTIRHRRSTRAFTPDAMDPEAFGRIMGHGYPRAEDPAPNGVLAPDTLATYVVLSAVDGMEPGIYRYDEPQHALHPLRLGHPRRVLQQCCLWQELGRDCAAAVIHVFDLDGAVERLGDRAYRSAHLEAGVIGERLNIAALRLGYGASGIAGFFDEFLSRFLDLGPEYAVAYVTTLGIPSEA